MKKHPIARIEDVYWPTYVKEVHEELTRNPTRTEKVMYKEALSEAIRRRTSGQYRLTILHRDQWNLYVRTILEDMRKTYGPNVSFAEAVAEACTQKDAMI